jgi:hypothetical protein
VLVNPTAGVSLIDPLTGRTLFAIKPDGSHFIIDQRFSPDSQHLALAVSEFRDNQDGTAVSYPRGTHLWHARNARLVPLKGRLTAWSGDFEFSPDGHKLLVIPSPKEDRRVQQSTARGKGDRKEPCNSQRTQS